MQRPDKNRVLVPSQNRPAVPTKSRDQYQCDKCKEFRVRCACVRAADFSQRKLKAEKKKGRVFISPYEEMVECVKWYAVNGVYNTKAIKVLRKYNITYEGAG